MNYAQLKAAFLAYANNTQAAAALDYLLPLAEQRIYFGEQNTPALRISKMLKAGSTATLPVDWLEMQRVATGGSTGGVKMEFIPYSQLLSYQSTSGVPYGYSINAGQVVLAPGAGSTLAYTYYARFTTPVADTDSNWLTDSAPGIYLSAMLIEWGKRTRDDELAARESGNYTSAVMALMSQDKAAQYSGATLRMRGPRDMRNTRQSADPAVVDPNFDAAAYFNNLLN